MEAIRSERGALTFCTYIFLRHEMIESVARSVNAA